MKEEHNTHELDFHKRTDFNFKNIELTTALIIDAALKRGIKAEFILGKYLQLTYAPKDNSDDTEESKKLFRISDNSSLSYLAQQISASKTETKEFLKRAGISVPEGRRFQVSELETITKYVGEINGPTVIKPDSGSEGKGVYVGVVQQDIPDILKEISKNYKQVAVEKQVFGNEYRVMATIDDFTCVCMRRPASVLGDSGKTIYELIEEKNIGRVSKATKPLTCPFIIIEVDDVVKRYLAKHNLTLDYVPADGERVYLRENSNISTGGDGIDMTAEAHSSVRALAKRALSAIPGMTYAGIDLITPDISKDLNDASATYAIIEMNNMPGIWPLHYPYIGKSRDAAGALVDLVFPETKNLKTPFY